MQIINTNGDETEERRLSRHEADPAEATGDQNDDEICDDDSVGLWDAVPFLTALFGSSELSPDEQQPPRRKTRSRPRLDTSLASFAVWLASLSSVERRDHG